MKTYAVRIPNPLSEKIDSAVKQGRYASASDLLRTAIRAELEKDEEEAREGDD